jgi:hypothetical protein
MESGSVKYEFAAHAHSNENTPVLCRKNCVIAGYLYYAGGAYYESENKFSC